MKYSTTNLNVWQVQEVLSNVNNQLVHECRSDVKPTHVVIKVESAEECNHVTCSKSKSSISHSTETHLIRPQTTKHKDKFTRFKKLVTQSQTSMLYEILVTEVKTQKKKMKKKKSNVLTKIE